MAELYNQEAEEIRAAYREKIFSARKWWTATAIASLGPVAVIMQTELARPERVGLLKLPGVIGTLLTISSAVAGFFKSADATSFWLDNVEVLDTPKPIPDKNIPMDAVVLDVPLEVIEREEQEMRDWYGINPEESS